jgi:hypothetical protein
MKKRNLKSLMLHKQSISKFHHHFEEIKGGVSGTTCNPTRRYYNTCHFTCNGTQGSK